MQVESKFVSVALIQQAWFICQWLTSYIWELASIEVQIWKLEVYGMDGYKIWLIE
jgi:hypothetical protein